MNIIVAVDNKWGIGKNNGLLFKLPADMSFFKEKTMNKVVAMGGNTLLSFPKSKPLPNRVNIVLSDVFTRDDCKVLMTLDEMKAELAKYPCDDIFIIGGAMFYKTMLPYCDRAYVTKVDEDGEAQVFFPNLDELPNWQLEEVSEPQETNGHIIRFTTYTNTNPLKLD